MADLQPGDLVFPANPGEHVAMYIGGGQIIEAPHTGAVGPHRPAVLLVRAGQPALDPAPAGPGVSSIAV